MTTPDTKAIRAQMEALTGFTAGPWNADLGETTYRVKADGMNIATANFVTLLDRIPTDQVGQNVRLIAAAPDIHATILALCAEVDAERRARAVTQANSRETWQALCATRNHLNEHFPMPSLESDLLQGPENSVFCAAVAEAVVNALAALRAENERLQTIIGNLHTVEGKHRETANAHFHRANRLQAENERLRNFIVDFSETKFDRIDRRASDPQDDMDPLTDYLAIEAWQEDARAAIAQKGGE